LIPGDELVPVSDGHSAAQIFGLLVLFAMLMLQGILPLNPQQLPGCPGIWR
jgi:hypothetical protein